MDVLEMDAASESGVEKVREHIVEASEYQPSSCRYRIFIIDEVHDLSGKAFDALLKTIEEPPAHAIFILATTEFHKVPPTIRSRCQKFEFHRGSVSNLVKRLNYVIEQEGFEADAGAVTAIARLSDGGYRDALTLLEQAVLTMDGRLTLAHVYDQLGLISDELSDELILAMTRGDLGAIVTQLEALYSRGRDPQAILESLMYRLADLTRAMLGGAGTGDAAVDAGLSATAARVGPDLLLGLRGELASRHKAVRDVGIPRIWLEAELLKIAIDLRAGGRPSRAETRAAEEPRSVVVAKDPEPKPESKPEPVGSAVVERVSGDLGAVWRAVVDDICAISKAAAVHIGSSETRGLAGGVVTIGFAKEVNADWVKGKPKLIAEIRARWKARSGEEVDFEFVSEPSVRRGATPMEGISVESPLEGDRLRDAAKRIFGSESAEN
jgi:DNA polymerase-3 subunit gamma/tau